MQKVYYTDISKLHKCNLSTKQKEKIDNGNKALSNIPYQKAKYIYIHAVKYFIQTQAQI